MRMIVNRLYFYADLHARRRSGRAYAECVGDDMQDAFPEFWTILNSIRLFHHLRPFWTKMEHLGQNLIFLNQLSTDSSLASTGSLLAYHDLPLTTLPLTISFIFQIFSRFSKFFRLSSIFYIFQIFQHFLNVPPFSDLLAVYRFSILLEFSRFASNFQIFQHSLNFQHVLHCIAFSKFFNIFQILLPYSRFLSIIWEFL